MDFKYTAKASNGKNMSGNRSADSEAALVSWIRDNGWVPINIERTHEVALQIGESVAKKYRLRRIFRFIAKSKVA